VRRSELWHGSFSRLLGGAVPSRPEKRLGQRSGATGVHESTMKLGRHRQGGVTSVPGGNER
jgi:hypothetical protein